MIDFGDPRLPDRFWQRVSPVPFAGCWLWLGSQNAKGYGRISVGRHGAEAAHRFAYEHVHGTIPPGLQLDHLCRVTGCVNPAHLEPVTARENLMRGDTLAAKNASLARCRRGHPFDERNTMIRRRPNGKTARQCRTCTYDNERALLRQEGT